MAIEILQELILHLPSELVERIQKTAERRHMTPGHVVSEALGVLMPTATDSQDEETRDFVMRLAKLPTAELRRKAEARWSSEDQARLSELLTYNGERTLSDDETEELEALLDKAHAISMEGFASKWILDARKKASRLRNRE